MVIFRFSFMFSFLLGTAIVNAQQTPITLGYVKMSCLRTAPSKIFIGGFQSKKVGTAWQMADSPQLKFSPIGIAPTYYTAHLGVVCKEELKLEKAIKFPLKIRLGSKQQVDYLEGKFYNH